MLKKYITLTILISMFFFTSELTAQPGSPTPCPDGSAPPCSGGPPPPPGRPIDAGLGILLIAGAAYGIKKLKKQD